jgi:hypothetical protein
MGAVILLLSFAALAFADLPRTIGYQGYVMDSATGAPLNTTVPMTFSLYSSTRAGSAAVWNETQPNVSVNKGIFSVQLGAASPGQTIIAPFDVPYYLGVKINGTGELPLQPLTSVPYALMASSVADKSVKASSLAINCGEGQVLVKTLTGWECGMVCSCPLDQQNCGGTCANLLTDRTHCGTCGTMCPNGQVCSNGSCMLSCQTGLTNCSNTCVNLATDEANCGECGKPCGPGQICSTGICYTVCTSGLTNCSGQCRDLKFDPNNCGGCNFACNPGKACLNSACQP